MTLNKWLESGQYVFVVLSESGYQQSSLALESWPNAVIYGEYRMINLDKSKAQYFYDYAVGKGFTPVFSIKDTTPMLLTWDEAIEFTKRFEADEDI